MYSKIKEIIEEMHKTLYQPHNLNGKDAKKQIIIVYKDAPVISKT